MKHKNWKRFRKSPYFPITLLAVTSLALGTLTWHVGHKPSSQIMRQPSSSASACVPVLTQDESHMLLMNLSRINQDYFSGRSSEEKRDINLTELFRQLGAEQSPKRAGWIKAEVALHNEKEISDFIAGLTFKQMARQSLTDHESAILEDLQVSDPQGYVDDSVLRTESYYETLRAHGARYDVATQAWDLSGLKLNALGLQDQPGVYLSLATLFSPVLAASLLEPNRREAVIHNYWVFFPPIKSGSQGTLFEGEIAIWSLTKYQEAVKRDLEFFSETLKNFLLASEQMTTFSHIFRGIGQEGLYRYITPNLKIAGSDMTGEELAYVTYREHLSGTAYRLIFDYGVPEELKDKLFETIEEASNIDDQNRRTQIEKIKLIRKSVIALAALPVVVYFAPAAGGLISAKMATFVGSSAAVMALMPMAFGAGLAIVNASIYQQRYGGDWFCHFAEEMTEKGLGSFYMAPYMAAIPVGAALAAAAPMAGAAAADSLAGTLVGAYAAPVIYGGLNIGVALYFVQDMGRHGYTGLSDCQSKIKKMYDLAQDDGASEAHLNMLLTEGMAQCAQGGFDIAFALSGGSTLAVRGYRGAGHIREAQTQRQAQVAKAAEVNQRIAQSAAPPAAAKSKRTTANPVGVKLGLREMWLHTRTAMLTKKQIFSLIDLLNIPKELKAEYKLAIHEGLKVLERKKLEIDAIQDFYTRTGQTEKYRLREDAYLTSVGRFLGDLARYERINPENSQNVTRALRDTLERLETGKLVSKEDTTTIESTAAERGSILRIAHQKAIEAAYEGQRLKFSREHRNSIIDALDISPELKTELIEAFERVENSIGHSSAADRFLAVLAGSENLSQNRHAVESSINIALEWMNRQGTVEWGEASEFSLPTVPYEQ